MVYIDGISFLAGVVVTGLVCWVVSNMPKPGGKNYA